jgi:hypothetical protein
MKNAYVGCQQAAGGGSKFADVVMRNIFGSSSNDSHFFDDWPHKLSIFADKTDFALLNSRK